jgi:hypothetical protein
MLEERAEVFVRVAISTKAIDTDENEKYFARRRLKG